MSEKEYASDGGHWYDKQGNPRYTIIGANGKERNTTLRDAKKNNWYRSVTTICSIPKSTGLDIYMMKQYITAALTLPEVTGESLEDRAVRIMYDAKQHAKDAADTGSLIHTCIEKSYIGEPYDPQYMKIVDKVREVILEKTGRTDWSAEKSFAKDIDGLWYGGKVDLHCPYDMSGSAWVMDFKTKAFDNDKKPDDLVYDQHVMQLVACAYGLNIPSARLANVYISVTNPGLVIFYEHAEEEIMRAYGMFLSLLQYSWINDRRSYAKDCFLPRVENQEEVQGVRERICSPT